MYYKGGFSLGLFGIALLVMNTPYIAEASPHPDAKTFMKGGSFVSHSGSRPFHNGGRH